MRPSLTLSALSFAAVAVLGALAVFACSSSSSDSTCPGQPPAQGASCSVAAGVPLACEYGVNANGACGTLVSCGSQGEGTPFVWNVSAPAAGCGVNAPTCPGSFTARADGTACDPSASSTCDYSEGRCACVACGYGQSSQGTWQCLAWSAGAQGCPTPRPELGTACSATQEGQECFYDFVCSGVPAGGPDMKCTSGVWRETANGEASCVTSLCAGDAGADAADGS
jgi:hypothetical protein